MAMKGISYGLRPDSRASRDASNDAPRILIIGAGARGHAYARAITDSTTGIVAAIAEPVAFKLQDFGARYVWPDSAPAAGQSFTGWRDFHTYEVARRARAAAGDEAVPLGVDAALICTLDTQHAEIVRALAPLRLHLLCEKPLATTLPDCLSVLAALQPGWPAAAAAAAPPRALFGIGHVLRYSPHNMLLRELVLRDGVVGDVLSMEHTEPIGYWHAAHSYVRGHWRKESTTAPSLLTKSCHDIDFILWLLCSAPPPSLTSRTAPPHLPSTITSTGQLAQFRRSRKPARAGAATNCLSCPAEPTCIYSAKKIYLERHLRQGKTDWPVKIVNPEIEDCYNTQGPAAAEAKLTASLAEDYDVSGTPQADIDARPWFGRCVWESANDVCDDQTVTLTWTEEEGEEEEEEEEGDVSNPPTQATESPRVALRSAKTATFHMIAHSEAQCERRGRIYGTHGELSYDSRTIRVFDFRTGTATEHRPPQRGGGHGGGDDGLAAQFVGAVAAVKSGAMGVREAQDAFLGASLDEVVRSHAVVFAAEEARRQARVVDWRQWWDAVVRMYSSVGGGA